MKKLELHIDDQTYATWLIYAKDAGMPLDILILEATRYSINSDRLGVEETRLQALLRQTREAELTARLSKVTKPSTVAKKQSPSEHPVNNISSVEDENIIQINNAYDVNTDDSHINMSLLEEAVTREV